MKTIFVKNNTPVIDGDTRTAMFPMFCEFSINEANEPQYQDSIVEMTPEDVIQIEADIRYKEISRLWEECNKYQQDRIATLGIVNLNAKTAPNTKAQEIIQWVNDLWNEYAIRRARIATIRPGNSFDEVDEVNNINIDIFDFSNMGNIPHSYFDAMGE